jgi:hypothetical protein
MLGVMSVTVLDAACTSMYHLFSWTGNGCWYAMYGVHDDTERRKRRIDAEALMRTVRAYLSDGRAPPSSERGSVLEARRSVESTLSEVESLLEAVHVQQQLHSRSWFAYWSSSGCAPLLDDLESLVATLNRRFMMLLEVARVA